MIGTVQEIVQWLFSNDLTKKYEVKEHKQKRSLDANAYAWQLINKIANETKRSNDDVYFQMLKDYGQVMLTSVLAEIDVKGFYKYYELAGTSILNEKEFNHYKIYKGSSEYNSKEMSVLIEGIVHEAQQLGISTMTLNEIASLKGLEDG